MAKGWILIFANQLRKIPREGEIKRNVEVKNILLAKLCQAQGLVKIEICWNWNLCLPFLLLCKHFLHQCSSMLIYINHLLWMSCSWRLQFFSAMAILLGWRKFRTHWIHSVHHSSPCGKHRCLSECTFLGSSTCDCISLQEHRMCVNYKLLKIYGFF